jgi:hypothetical protein
MTGEHTPGCVHPEGDLLRDPEDGTVVCMACSQVIEPGTDLPPALGSTDPRDTPEEGPGVLSRIPWPPGPGTVPYTPENVEHEIIDMVARLNSGARFQAGKERELQQAEVAFELSYARKLLEAPGRSQDMRKAWAVLQVEEEWTRVQVLRQVVRTTREGMHTLRAQLSGLQTVNRSVGAAAGTGYAPQRNHG